MKLFMMTDLEGVAGVLNADDWIYPSGRYYETAKRLLTAQVNAAAEGFLASGFEDIVVADGHGAGAIDVEALDPRLRLLRGWSKPPYPFGLDGSFHAVAYLGQHARAGTPFSHLTHTGSFETLRQELNGIPIGEYGEGAFCAGELGIPVIFATGEKALCDEVAQLTPWVVTVPVLQGVIGGSGDELSAEQYAEFHVGAIHLQPRRACELIRAGARQAAAAFGESRARFKPLTLPAPYHLVRAFRPAHGRPGRIVSVEHPESVIGVLNRRFQD